MTETTTKPKMIFNPSVVSKDIDLPPEEKKVLPSPTIISELRCGERGYSIDIRDHLGREWMICAKDWKQLRYKLRYFKTLDRGVIDALFADRPRKPIPLLQWTKVKDWRCASCKSPARVNPMPPHDPTRWCCATCEQENDAGSAAFENLAPVVKPVAKAEKPKVAEKPAPDQTVGMSLKERLEFRKKAK